MKSARVIRINAIALLIALSIPISLAAQEPPTKQQKYSLVDIGTFGGPSSGFVGVGAHSVNNRGTATGGAETPTPDPYAPNCFTSDCFVAHTFLSQDGGLPTDMGALPGVNNSGPNDINANGMVTGISENGSIDPTTGLPEYDAVVWKNGQIINLGTFGGNWSYANALNNEGQVAGFALNTTPDSFNLGDFCMNGPFPTQMQAFIWQNGVMQNLGTLGGPDSCALWLNQSGQAAGHSFTNSTPNSTTGIPTLDPFLWDRRRMIDLGTLGGTLGVANWLNNRGQVVGQSNLAGDLTAHPFLWDRGSLKDLGTLGGTFGVATSVSDAGVIVGGATNQNDQAFLAFVWKNGVMTDLGTLPGDDCSLATNINSGGQIVGFSFPCAGGPSHAFLWDKGSLVDLNTFVPSGSELQLTEATYINDRREISVQGVLPNGDTRAVLLVPGGQGETLVSATHARTVTQHSLTPSEIMAAVRARLGKRYHIPSLEASPRD
jgi:probable HAF family extracellular repeat protein